MHTGEMIFLSREQVHVENTLYKTDILEDSLLTEDILQIIPSILMILDQQRQAVYANQQLYNLSTTPNILGKRPGEIFNCIHAREHEDGCGATVFCNECGANKAILKSRKDQTIVEEECRIISENGEAYDLQIRAAPYDSSGTNYTIFSVTDIRHMKRRQALERTFFHDVNNILGIILGYSELIDHVKDTDRILEYVDIIQTASKGLVEEVASHNNLLQAENGNLPVKVILIEPLTLLNDIMKLFSTNHIWKNRKIVINTSADASEIKTDRALLRRVLGNMVKNALEATDDDAEVRLNCVKDGSSMVFSVHNPGYMPRSAQLQVFQRSFSTKGLGRGIGTYSMKLFGEGYLKGRVWFSTTKDRGTTFYISLPLAYEDAGDMYDTYPHTN